MTQLHNFVHMRQKANGAPHLQIALDYATKHCVVSLSYLMADEN